MNRKHVPFMPPNEHPMMPWHDAEVEAALAEIRREELKRLETEEMEKHFRDHPHG